MLGGTFDPVHLGHLVVASEVHDALGLDEVVLVPTGRPWQKSGRPVTDGDQRLLMTGLAVADDTRMNVSRVDVDRPGPTYSADTVRDLRAQHGPEAELFFLTGADALAGLPTWHAVEDFLAEAVVVGFARNGHPLEVPAGLPDGISADRFRFVDTTVVDLSSTDVRARVAAGQSIRYLVPDAVEAHIRATGLYRDVA